ncbi:MAG: FAD:protein FMN transferase [Gammaproteobacteria bacterium]
MTDINVELLDGYVRGQFMAMASPCEILIEKTNREEALKLVETAHQEVIRIEQKFSRYRNDNIVYKINHSAGRPVEVDEEMSVLLDYAEQCYDISEGLFDITSGVLREIWQFDGSDNVPSEKAVSEILPRIGWKKVQWEKPYLTLPEGMEIDLGGIGKEYAVDRTALILQQHRPQKNGKGWVVGVEDPDELLYKKENSIKEYALLQGGLATSGDARRYLIKNDIRYGHILNPKTGWPVLEAPRSITVAAGTCTEAGILSTLAMLQGKNAENFLKEQGVTYWCIR